MEVNTSRPTNEAAQLNAASLQNVRFKDRRLRDAQSDVHNEAVYFSPVIRIDNETHTAIIQYRDTTTGEVEKEYPAPPKKGAYQDINNEAAAAEQSAPQKQAAPVVSHNDVNVSDDSQKPVEHVDQNA